MDPSTCGETCPMCLDFRPSRPSYHWHELVLSQHHHDEVDLNKSKKYSLLNQLNLIYTEELSHEYVHISHHIVEQVNSGGFDMPVKMHSVAVSTHIHKEWQWVAPLRPV